MKLQLADDVLVWPVRERGEMVYRVEVPRRHKFFRLGYREYFLLSLFDGETTLPQACSITTAKLGRDAPTMDEANTIVRWFIDNEVVRDSESRAPRDSSQTKTKFTEQIAKINPFWLKLPLPGAERFIRSVSRRLQPVLSPAGVLIGSLVILLGLVMLAIHRDQFFDAGDGFFHPSRWIWIGLIFVSLKFVHELGHAIACERQRCHVNQCGVVFVLLAPLAYVDVTSCWRLESRAKRMLVSGAGMFVEIVIASLAMIVWTMSDDPMVSSVAQTTVFTAGIATVLFNANVLMRFDGYYLLADGADIPNLSSEAQMTLRRIAKRWLLGQSDRSPSEFSGWRRGFVFVYAIASLAWKVIVCSTLLIAASTLFHGAGILLVMVGVLMWFGTPLWRLRGYMLRLKWSDPWQFYRGSLLTSILVLGIGALVFGVPLPSSVNVPVMTQWSAETEVRARVDGFIDEIYVTDGQSVQPGDPMMHLKNEELQAELQQLETDAQSNLVQRRGATGGHDESGLSKLLAEAKAIDERYRVIKQRFESLLVRATIAGTVVGSHLDQRQDTYVEEGQHLVNLVNENDQEWTALIAPQQIRSIREQQGHLVVVRLVDGREIETRFDRIAPSASDRLPHPALAAINGGSLPTKDRLQDDDDDALRLIQPYFRASLDVPSDANVLTGMRLTADCGYRRETVAVRVRSWIRGLWDGRDLL